MARDFILSAGVRFDPRDIDTKQIRKAITTAIQNMRVNLSIRQATVRREAITSVNRIFSDKLRIHLSAKNFSFNQGAILARLGKALRGVEKEFKLKVGFDKAHLRAQVTQALKELGVTVPAKVKLQKPTQTETARQVQPTGQLVAEQEVQNMANLVRVQRDLQQITPPLLRGQAQLSQILKNSGVSAEFFGGKIAQVTTRFAAYAVSIRGIFALQNAFNNSLRAIVEFDNVLADLQKVLQQTPQNLSATADAMFRVADETGRTFNDVAVSLNTFARQGLGSVEQALEFTRAALIATNVTELSSAEATRFLTTVTRVYSDEARDLEGVLDILTVTADNAATTAQGLAQAFVRSGAAAKAVGVTYRELTAITASVIETTQASAERVGTALKTIFSRLVTTNDKIREQANAWGANISATDGVIEILTKLSGIYGQLDVFQRGQLAYLVAGRRRFTEFAAILEGFTKTNELLAKQQDAAGTSARKQEIELQKLSVQATQIRNIWNEFIQELAGTKEGAEGVGLLRGLFSTLLGTVREFSLVLRDTAGFITDLAQQSDLVTASFKTIAKTALFTVGVSVIRGIVSGFRQVVQVGKLIQGVLINISGREKEVLGAILRQAQAAEGALSVDRQRLSLKERILNAEQRSANLSVRRNAITIRRPQGPFSGVRRRAQGVGRAVRGAVGAGARRLGATAGGLFVAQVAADRLSDNAEQLGVAFGGTEKASQKLTEGMVRASSSSINLGATVAAITGSLQGGLLVGLTTLAVSLFRLQFEIDAQLRSLRQNTLELNAMRVAVIDVRNSTSQFAEITREIASQRDGVANALDEVSVFSVATRFAATSAERLESGLSELATVTENVNNRLRAATAQLDFQKALDEASSSLRGQIAEIEVGLETGNFSREFDPFIQAISQLETKVQEVDSVQKGILTTSEAISNAFAIQAQLQDATSTRALSLLRTQGLISDEANNFIRAQREAANETSVALQKNEAAILGLTQSRARFESALEEAKENQLAISKNEVATEDEKAAALDNINRLQNAISAATEEIAEREAVNERLLGRINDAQETINRQVEEEVKRVQDIAVSYAQVANNLDLTIAKGKEKLQDTKEENDELRAQLALQRSLAARGGDFADSAAGQAARRIAEIQREIAQQERNFENEIARIQQAQAQARAAGRTDQLQRLQGQEQARARQQAEQLQELRRSAILQLQIELEQPLSESIRSQQEELARVEINRINNVLEAEREVSNRRIEIIKRLADSPELFRSFRSEISRLSTSLVEEFGTAGALIVQEQRKQTAEAVQAVQDGFSRIRGVGLGPSAELQAGLEARERLITLAEEQIANERETILDRVKNSAEEVSDAEEKLAEARNEIPQLNANIINAEKQIAQARKSQEEAVRQFFNAAQAAADAQVQYNVELAKARAQVVASTAGAGDFGEKLGALNTALASAVGGVRASEEQILQIRADIAQQALGIYQQQFNAVKGIATQAATATEEEISKIRGTLAAGRAVAGGANVLSIPEELRAGLSSVAQVIPGLEDALQRQGAELLGISPGVFESIEGQMLELARTSAETGQSQVDAAFRQVAVSQTQVAQADQQIQEAKNQLQVQEQIRDRAIIQANYAQRNVGAVRATHETIAREANRSLDRLTTLTGVNKNILAAINSMNANIEGSINDLKGNLSETVNTLKSITGGTALNAAGGTLSNTEIGGLIRAARREKAAMPPGSRLMLANTSEVVLNRRQASQMGMRALPKANAQAGNAAAETGLTSAVGALRSAVESLNSSMSSAGRPPEQNFNVNVDTNKKVQVTGIDTLNKAMQQAFEERMSDIVDKKEFEAVRNTVVGLAQRMKEAGVR